MKTSLSRPHPLFPIPPLSISISVQSFSVRLRRPPSSVSVSVSVSASAAAPTPPSFGPEYLIHSCGLPPDEAEQAYDKISHLESPNKPDAVLRFLREMGISDSRITTVVSREPRILHTSVDRILRPNFAKLQEVGLSVEDLSRIISRFPGVFLCNLAPRINFLVGLLGSAQNFSLAVKRYGALLGADLDDVILPNLRFLQDHCGFSSSQIVRLVLMQPGLLAYSTEYLEATVRRTEELGFACSSGLSLYALCAVSRQSQHNLEARVNNLKNLGFSQVEVARMISGAPMLLGIPEKVVNTKIDFLFNEAGCGKTDILRNPFLLMCSLENRLIPRNVVRKLLMSKQLPPASNRFVSFVIATEKQFVDKYVLPYEHDIPGLYQAYSDACAGKE